MNVNVKVMGSDRIQVPFLNLFCFSKISTVHNRGNKLLKHNYRTRCIRPRGSYYANAIEKLRGRFDFLLHKTAGSKIQEKGGLFKCGV